MPDSKGQVAAVAETPIPFSGEGQPERFSDPRNFINRELSWLEFNRRVLEEAEDPSQPLIERVKFLTIFSSNLDEFFEIRVAGLKQRQELGSLGAGPRGRPRRSQRYRNACRRWDRRNSSCSRSGRAQEH